MRYGIVLLAALVLGCNDDTTGPRPSERFAGFYNLVEDGGSTLPHNHLTTAGDTIEHHLTSLDVNDDSFLPEALLVDSLVRRDWTEGTLALVNETVRATLVGFIKGDTVWFHDNESLDETRFRFTFDANGTPVRVTDEGEPVDEVWTRQ